MEELRIRLYASAGVEQFGEYRECKFCHKKWRTLSTDGKTFVFMNHVNLNYSRRDRWCRGAGKRAYTI